jgi:hypothetical protein
MGRGSKAAQTEGRGRAPRRALWVALCTLAIGVGVLAIALGGYLIATAQPTSPIEVDGSIVDYREILIDGSYARNELRLADDPHTYALDAPQFHPPLPVRFLQYGKVQIWVTQGTTTVVAVTLYDQLGLNPTTYTTDAYDHPLTAMVEAQAGGVATSVAGLILIAVAFVLLRRGTLSRRRKPTPPKPEPVAVLASVGASVGAAGQSSPRYEASPWDLTLFGGDRSGAQRGGDPAPPPPDAIDQTPTRKTPAVFPGMDTLGGDAPGRRTTPPAHGVPQTPGDIDQIPTEKTPAVPTTPPAPEDDFAMPWLGPPGPLPDAPSPPAPAFADPAADQAPWGAAWGPPPAERSDPPAWTFFQRPAPEGAASPAPPDQPAPSPAGGAEDVEDLPTQRTPAVQPPQRDPDAFGW